MKVFENHAIQVLDFLSTPFTVASMQTVKDTARKEGKNETRLLAHYGHELYAQFKSELSSQSFAHCDTVSDLFLEPWSQIYNGCVTPQVLEYFGSLNDSESKNYDKHMSAYWTRIASQCTQVSESMQAGDDSPKAILCKNMHKKIEWIRSGYVFEQEPYMTTLPLPTKSMLPNILSLFNNKSLGIQAVVAEVSQAALSARS